METIPELSTCRRCHLCAGSLCVSVGVARLVVVFRRFCLEDLESHATDLLAMQRRYGVLGTVTARKLRIAVITTYNICWYMYICWYILFTVMQLSPVDMMQCLETMQLQLC